MTLKYHNVEYNSQSMRVPYTVIKGKKKGPKMFICAGMHGDEINGILLIKNFLEWAEEAKLENKLSGEVRIFPVMNVSGFSQKQRLLVEDGGDLNRSFRKGKPSNLSEAVAQSLMREFFSDCDFGVDCHDSGQEMMMIPHTRVHKCEPDHCLTMSKKLAEYFDLEITIERKGKKEMLAVFMANEYEKSVLTLETGSIENAFVEKNNICLKGLINILIGMRMYPGELNINKKTKVFSRRFDVTIREAGYIDLKIKTGEFIHKGDEIGTIYYPLRHEYEKIISPICGLVFINWKNYQIKQGKELVSLLETKDCPIKHRDLSRKELSAINLVEIEM